MKYHIVYQGPREFYHAMLVSEDGFVVADHCCSHPCFMYGDLWERRKELQEKLKQREPQVDQTPYQIQVFKEKFPELFKLTFVEPADEA